MSNFQNRVISDNEYHKRCCENLNKVYYTRRKHFMQRHIVSTQQTPFMISSPSQPFLGDMAEHHHQVSEYCCRVTSVQDDWKVEQKDIMYYFLVCAHGDFLGINSLVLLTAYGLGSITIHMKMQ